MDLLNFSDGIIKPNYSAYSCMDKPDMVCAVPHSVGITNTPNGSPGFLLEAISGITPFSEPKPHAILQIQLSPTKITQAMLEEMRSQWISATIYCPDFNRGYLGIHMADIEDFTVFDELEKPIPLAHLPLSRLRYVKKINIEYLKLIKDALVSKILLMHAFGLYSVKGLAPQIPLKLNFEPKALTNFIINEALVLKEGDPEKSDHISLSLLKKVFNKPLEELPVKAELKEGLDSSSVAASLTDWYCTRFCELAPPVYGKVDIYFTLNQDAKTSGSFTWELKEPLVAERFIPFKMDALQEARNLMKQHGADQLFKKTIVNPLPTGFLRLQVFHPFFQIPAGLEQVGIKIKVPANPPLRPQAIQQTLAFDSDQGNSTILRFSPSEPQIFNIIPYAIYGDTNGTKEVNGDSLTFEAQELNISEEMYPFSFISISCSQNILSHASSILSIVKKGQEVPLYEKIVLDSSQPSTMIALLKENPEEIEGHVIAKELDGDREAVIIFPLTTDRKIDLTAFPQYGSHQVFLKLNTDEAKIMGVELLPEHLEPIPQNITTINLGANKKETTWRWFSPSIFGGGFSYRLVGEGNEPWSKIYSPFTGTLILEEKKSKIA